MSRARFWIAWWAGATALPAFAALAETPPAEAYRLHCSGCHLADGRGVEGTIPSLRSLAPLLEAKGGRAYLGRVPGVAQAPIDSASLAALMNWVLQELSQIPSFEPYEAAEIDRYRRLPLRDPIAARPLAP